MRLRSDGRDSHARKEVKRMQDLRLEVEELEERIAPSAIGNPVPAGANPQPSGGGGHNNPVPNGSTPQPK
jgi:hypothetical protein